MKNSRLSIAAFFGAITGFFLGWLTAPKSGEETREDIKHAANKAKDEVEERFKQAHDQLSKTIDEAKDKFKGNKLTKMAEEKIKESIAIQKRVSKLAGSVGGKKTDDKKLEEAILEVNQATKKLQAYLRGK